MTFGRKLSEELLKLDKAGTAYHISTSTHFGMAVEAYSETYIIARHASTGALVFINTAQQSHIVLDSE